MFERRVKGLRPTVFLLSAPGETGHASADKGVFRV
jgi:hypothetical protein